MLTEVYLEVCGRGITNVSILKTIGTVWNKKMHTLTIFYNECNNSLNAIAQKNNENIFENTLIFYRKQINMITQKDN